jgi:hypothetical protein
MARVGLGDDRGGHGGRQLVIGLGLIGEGRDG